MKSFLELANDAPRLSQRDLNLINNNHGKRDHAILARDGLGGMERMENWGVP